jgi:HK97 gp10 family phage protein
VSAVDKILAKIAVEVQRDAKVRAPVDTGTLQWSITSGRFAADESRVEYHVGTSIHYAIYQEFGTRYMPAQPYLVPALMAIGVAKYGGKIGS